ncbi:MAG: TlpA disulfide reductase family protein [Bacteroidota bacterium]
MKTHYLFCIILLLSIVGQKTFSQAGPVKLTLRIDDLASNQVILKNNHWENIDTLSLLDTNPPSYLTTLTASYYYLVIDGMQLRIFLKEGMDLTIELDKDDFPTSLVYNGKGAVINNYLAAKHRLTNGLPFEVRSYNGYGQLDEAAFIKQSNDLYKSYLDLFNESKAAFDPSFAYLEQKSIEIQHANRLVEFEGIKKMLTGDNNYKNSNNFPDGFGTVDLNDSRLLATYRYADFVHNYYNQATMNSENSSNFFVEYLNMLSQPEVDQSIKDLLGYKISKYGFSYSKNIDAFYNTYLSYAKDPTLIQKFQERYFQIKTEAGKPAPNFTFEDVNGKTYQLEDFRGKYVYIDLWATWCKPCLEQMPALKELVVEFSDKIHFVSVAWKDDLGSWKKYINKEKLSGVQLFSEEQDAAFFKFFQVSGIPRFILLDKEGNILESRAKQPSNAEIRKQFESL